MCQSRRETWAWGSVATRGFVNGRDPRQRRGRDSTVGAYCPQALVSAGATSYHTKRILPNQQQQSKNEELTNLENKNAELKCET